MRRALSWTALSVFFATCVQAADPPAKGAAGTAAVENRAATDVGDWIIGPPIRHANLTVFPISSRTPRTEDRFITLDAGLRAGSVDVMEVGATVPAAGPIPEAGPAPAAPGNQFAREVRGDVNRLIVVNRSGKPLYLMPGEIMIGGKQDRAVGGEYVIAPDGKPTPINVFCVEHGRWAARASSELSALLRSAQSNSTLNPSVAVSGGERANVAALSIDAAQGKFVGSVGNLSKQSRLALQGSKNQSAVWNEVGNTNGMNRTRYGSGAFTGNYTLAEAAKPLEAYVGTLAEPIDVHPSVVGVIVAVNGRVETADVFESTPLFRQLWPKLLKSYALDAALAGRRTPTPKEGAAAGGAAGAALPERTCPPTDAHLFLTKVVSEKAGESETNGDIVTKTVTQEGVIGFRAHQQRTSGGGARRPAVHVGGFAL